MVSDDYTMDRPRQEGASSSIRRIAWVTLAIVAILAFIAVDRWWLRAADGVELADFVTADVQRGALSIEVQGAGSLEAVAERWIATEIQGVVEEVFVRPGQKVAHSDKIVRLANPLVRRRLAQARLALAEIEADHRSHGASVTDRSLAAEARMLDVQADYDEQQLRLQAQAELREQNAVSEIDFRSQQIRTKRAKVKVEFERRRLEELRAALDAEREASAARVAARRTELIDVEAELAALDVTAIVPGTVREILVDPGVRVAAGARVARVVDTSSLMAVVRIPEFYASHLAPGQHAIATVLSSAIPGFVTRVDPAVTEGTVAVDIEFAGPLPPGVRPELSVRATITVAELRDVLFVRRPVHVRDHAAADVFVLARDESIAARTSAHFGMGTLKHVQIIQGLQEGDTLLLGNTSRLADRDVVAVR